MADLERRHPYGDLQRLGYAVIPVLGPEETARFLARVEESIREMPEFVPGFDRRVLGAFGALGNAASFHCPVVRELRVRAHRAAVSSLFGGRLAPGEKLEQLVDRLSKRLAGVAPGRETWHRDISPYSRPAGDSVYGGWINLDPRPQHLSCVPGSHLDPRPAAGRGEEGFATFDRKDAELMNFFRGASEAVEVPPGHALVFVDGLVHEVLSEKKPFDSYRLYLAWRVTRSETGEPLVPVAERLLADQAVVPLKSGQVPPMYAALHWCTAAMRAKIVRFAEGVVPACRERRTVKTTGETLDVVVRHMPSLRDLGAMYPEYAPWELALYRPGVRWTVRVPGDGEGETVTETLSLHPEQDAMQ